MLAATILQTCVVLALLVFSAVEAHGAGFVLKKTGSGHEPEAYEVTTLPGTDMKAGTFRFVLDEDNETAKAGMLLPNKILYYVEHERYSHRPLHEKWRNYEEVFDAGGDCNYGVYNDYFTLDCWAYGSVSGHNRKMFLFRFGNDTVELQDVIGEAYVGAPGREYGMDFRSAFVGERTKPVWTDVKDFDDDGNPELVLLILRGHYREPAFYFRQFALFIEIKDGKLIVDLNPELYRPFYEDEKHEDASGGKSDAYYIFGFLSGKLELEKIKSVLKSEGESYKGQYEAVVTLLENRDRWDAAFHDYGDDKPVLMRYELNRR